MERACLMPEPSIVRRDLSITPIIPHIAITKLTVPSLSLQFSMPVGEERILYTDIIAKYI